MSLCDVLHSNLFYIMTNTETRNEVRADFFIINGKKVPAEEFDNSILFTGTSFYEVLKVREKVPLFLEDHLERLEYSVLNQGADSRPPLARIKENLIMLIAHNPSVINGNIKIILHYRRELHHSPDIFSYYTPHRYPSSDEYTSGVDLILVHAERQSVHSKIINPGFRAAIDQKIKSANAWEALLVDKNGFITEGSKSNFFLIKENKIITTPGREVLPGITRKKILDICGNSQIEIIERKTRSTETDNYDSCFISGTSPGVLAVRSIEATRFSRENHILNKIAVEYENREIIYVRKNKHKFNKVNTKQ